MSCPTPRFKLVTVTDDLRPPATRAECFDAVRPCARLACTHHLHTVGVAKDGRLRVSLEAASLPESCVLDVAAAGEHDSTEISKLLGVTKQGALALEWQALDKLRKNRIARELSKEFVSCED